MKRAYCFALLALVPPSASSFVSLRPSSGLLFRARTALGVRFEGLNRDMDPNRNEPITIHFANREPDAFQTAAAYNCFLDLLCAAEHFRPPATRG
jgi:hypothetical protein